MIRNVCILLLFPIVANAQKNYPVILDSLMRGEVSELNFNGNVLVAKSGSIIYQKSFGYKDYFSGEELDTNSVFYMASVSKQFTAMGILILTEQKKISLDDTLRNFFPQLPYYNITIRQMLTHTSGLPKYEVEMPKKWDHKKIAFNNDLIAFFANEKIPPRFLPGKKWEYSNTAYILLASIIEKVSGQTFADFMEENIFKPLGMEHSRIYNTRRSSHERIPDYAYGFMYSDSLKRYMLPDSMPFYGNIVYQLDGIEGDGSVNTTTSDLFKWEQALINQSIFSKNLREQMLEPHSLMDTTLKIYYGYGVILGENETGKYITHTGIWPGYRTVLTHYKNEDITIIVLSNNESNVQAISNALTYVLFDREVIFPYVHKEINLDPKISDRYTGKYSLGKTIIELIKKDGKLFRHVDGTSDIELKPESETKFFYDDRLKRQIEFELDTSGKPVRAFLIFGGIKNALKVNE